jgi:hypothetical protein
LPIDPKRKLPIPFVHDGKDGQWDFTAVLSERMNECVHHHLCGQCGKPLGWWLAFLGGPISSSTGVYTDPPMHEECARAALTLCPHINRANMKRSKLHAIEGERMSHSQYSILDRTTVWVLTITRGYEIIAEPGKSPLFRAKSIKRMHGWRNRKDRPGLVSLSKVELDQAILEAKARRGIP